jgi:hypothetical protein
LSGSRSAISVPSSTASETGVAIGTTLGSEADTEPYEVEHGP